MHLHAWEVGWFGDECRVIGKLGDLMLDAPCFDSFDRVVLLDESREGFGDA